MVAYVVQIPRMSVVPQSDLTHDSDGVRDSYVKAVMSEFTKR